MLSPSRLALALVNVAEILFPAHFSCFLTDCSLDGATGMMLSMLFTQPVSGFNVYVMMYVMENGLNVLKR